MQRNYLKVRRHTRILISGLADVWKEGSDMTGHFFNVSDMVICLINNISKGGIGAFSTVPLQAGDRVTIRRMNMSAVVSEDVITGTIVWVAGKDRSYNMGICFKEELSKDNNPELYKVLFEERYGVRPANS